jgi:putative PIN family toxin of toxin-antitoxin system
VLWAVFDTNVLASGFLSRATTPGRLLLAWQEGLFELVVTAPILEELRETLNDPYFRRRLTPEQIEENLALVRREATVVRITTHVRDVATRPEDDLVLAAALSGQAQYLVTGDAQLQRLGTYQGITILSPRAFWDILTV